MVIIGIKPWQIDFGGKHDVRDYWAVFSWVGALLGVVVFGVMVWICPWWAGGRVEPGPALPSTPRFFWVPVLGAVTLAAFFAFPRLNQPFWDDEELNVRDSILGKFKLYESPDQPVKFLKRDWEETWLEYRTPNNHILNSVLSRLSHETIGKILGPPASGLPFREWALRIPAYLAGVASIGALAWFLFGLGRPWAGAVAALLLALHPWHLRYASECRGYGLVLLLVPLLLGLWHRAIQRGGWGWWAGFAACQLAAVFSYPTTLFLLLVLNLATPVVMAFHRGAATPFRAQLGRWFCVNTLIAVPAITLLLTLLAQVRDYIQTQAEQGFHIGPTWLWNEVNYFLVGVPWWRASTEAAAYPEVVYRMGHLLPLYWVFVAGVVGLGLAGAWSLYRKGTLGTAILISIALPPIAICAFSLIKTQIIYEAYILFALPGLVACVAIGADTVGTVAARGVRLYRAGRQLFMAGFLGLLLIFYGWLTYPFRYWLRVNPLQPLSESVLLTRGTLDPGDPASGEILTGSFCIPPYLYDPRAIRLDSVGEMIALLDLADRTGRPLAINIGMPWAARDYSPAMWKLLNTPALFAPPTQLRGWDPGLDRQIYWYRNGSSSGFDFSEFEPEAR